ncbi:MAG: hypothetical protein IJ489_10125 [Clostridia bacterium]|nr:hypothetical protein [Clostridia bacterium]
MNDLQQMENHANIEKRNRKIVWSILISIPTIIILIGLIAYIYQTANPVDITNDFLTYFNMPDERMVLNSGYEAQIISIEKEQRKNPVVILTIAPNFVADGTTEPYHETVYEWMCIPNETKKEDLRKIGECVDTLWVPTYYDLMKEMYENFGTFSVSDLKEMPEAKEFYDTHYDELESANLLTPLIFFYSNTKESANNFTNREILCKYTPK